MSTLARSSIVSDLVADFGWCLDRIRAYLDAPAASLTAITPVAARTARIDRVVATADGRTHTFYLKTYPPSASPSALGQRFDDLAATQRAASRSPLLAPCRIVAADPRRRVLLTTEVPGRSLLDIHHAMTRCAGLGLRTLALRGWHGLGVWLRLLHSQAGDSTASPTRAREVAAYTRVRLTEWCRIDPRRTSLATRASDALARFDGQRTTVVVSLCQGDVCAANVLVGDRTGVVDPDDIGRDMPGVDVSQALLEIGEFGYLGSIVPLGGIAALARDAFLGGYGEPMPSGIEFWIPHLRNLSVQLLTLASRCRRWDIDRFTEEPHYRRAVRELTRSLDGIDRMESDG